jgi:hypothetical protein
MASCWKSTHLRNWSCKWFYPELMVVSPIGGCVLQEQQFEPYKAAPSRPVLTVSEWQQWKAYNSLQAARETKLNLWA